MNPITEDYLRKFGRLLQEAEEMIEAGFYEAAGRNAYLAALHAANAAIFEKTGCAIGKHKSTPQALASILHAENIHDKTLTAFLPRMMRFKEIADYETGGEGISQSVAENDVEEARVFNQRVKTLAEGLT